MIREGKGEQKKPLHCMREGGGKSISQKSGTVRRADERAATQLSNSIPIVEHKERDSPKRPLTRVYMPSSALQVGEEKGKITLREDTKERVASENKKELKRRERCTIYCFKSGREIEPTQRPKGETPLKFSLRKSLERKVKGKYKKAHARKTIKFDY